MMPILPRSAASESDLAILKLDFLASGSNWFGWCKKRKKK